MNRLKMGYGLDLNTYLVDYQEVNPSLADYVPMVMNRNCNLACVWDGVFFKLLCQSPLIDQLLESATKDIMHPHGGPYDPRSDIVMPEFFHMSIKVTSVQAK